MAVETDYQLRGSGRSAYHPPRDAAEVATLITFYQAIALHKLVVEVGQRFRLFTVHHNAQPETQPSNIDGTFLDINTVDVVFDDLLLQCHTTTHGLQGFAATPQLVQQTHGECT